MTRMTLFFLRESPMTKKVEQFSNLCNNDIVLVNCYRNRLQFGCTYNTAVEKRIDDIVSKFSVEEYPWWVDILD